MNLYSNILLFHLTKDDKHQSKGVSEFLMQNLVPQTKPKKIFHIDCSFTKKKVCYCTNHDSELLPKKERALYESTIEHLEDAFKGRDSKFVKDVFNRRTFFKEKYANFQEPEDVKFYLNLFEDPSTVAKPVAPTATEEPQNKRIHTDTNAFVNVKPNGAPSVPAPNPYQENMRRRRQEVTETEQSKSGRKSATEDDLDMMCHFKACTKDRAEPEDMMACSKCRKTFHAKCCSPPLSKKIVSRYPWYCNDCKLCFVCKLNVNENRMIICDICDRAFHSDCLTPKLTEIPHGDWYCNECKKCKSCTASLMKEPNFPKLENNLWNDEYLLCSKCLVRFEDKEYCPVCLTIVDDEEDGNYISCDQCSLWVHAECGNLPPKQLKSGSIKNYVCPICQSKK